MKTRFHANATWTAVITLLPFLGACSLEDQPKSEAAASSGSNPVVAAAAMNTNAVSTPLEKPTAPTNAAPVPLAPSPTAAPAKALPAFDFTKSNLAEGVVEVIRLVQAGVQEEVLTNYIGRSPFVYPLSADEIVYLNDLGVSPQVVAAMIRKEAVPAPEMAAPTPPAPPVEPAPAPNATNQMVTTTAPPAPTTTQAGSPPPAPAPQSEQVVVTQPAQPVQVVQQTVQPAYSYFYSSLAPYGNWIYVADYGYCWQPTVAVISPSWRPYCHGGRWAYTDCGWYWQSDYSWGWAPFHYGRWHSHPVHGWMWSADLHWGPAWVSWRSSPGYCGWAPLPPAACYTSGLGFTYYGKSVSVGFEFGLGYNHYTYLPMGQMCAVNPHAHAVHGAHAQNIHSQTVVNNTYINGNNNTVINQGIAYDQVAAVSKTPVRRLAVRDLDHDRSGLGRPDSVSRVGGEHVVYRKLAPPTPSAPGAASTSPAGPGRDNIPNRQSHLTERSAPLPTFNLNRPQPQSGQSAGTTPPELARSTGTGRTIPAPGRTIPPAASERSVGAPAYGKPQESSSGRLITPSRQPNMTPPTAAPGVQTQARADTGSDSRFSVSRSVPPISASSPRSVGSPSYQAPTRTQAAPSSNPYTLSRPQPATTPSVPASAPSAPSSRLVVPAPSVMPSSTPVPTPRVMTVMPQNNFTRSAPAPTISAPAPAVSPRVTSPMPQNNFTRSTPTPTISAPAPAVSPRAASPMPHNNFTRSAPVPSYTPPASAPAPSAPAPSGGTSGKRSR